MRKSPLVLSMALLATACGGSSTSSTDAAAEPIVTSEVTTTTEASTVNINRYCDIARAAEVTGDEFDVTEDVTPEVFEAFLSEMGGYFDEAIIVAEPAVSADLTMQVEQFNLLADAARAADYDIFAMLDDLIEIGDDPKYVASEEGLEAYDEKTCGIIPDEDEPEPEADDSTAAADAEELTLPQAEEIVQLIQTEAGMDAFVGGFLAEVPSMTDEQARCFATGMTAEQLVAISNLADVDSADIFGEPGVDDLIAGLDDCDIPLSAFLG